MRGEQPADILEPVIGGSYIELQVTGERLWSDRTTTSRPFDWAWLDLTPRWSHRDRGLLPEQCPDLGSILDVLQPGD